jgi:hypothetical protein
MSNKISWVLVVVFLFCAAGWTYSSKREATTNPVWEYKVVRTLDEKGLNELGSQGWELVTTVDNVSLNNGNGYSSPIYYFKRAK